eukprot:EC795700.1.p1 GENE.EC795700.1~~EC795700.1.p1  ORF type:complete len:161 (+),score=41.46 EC795700.1:61-543(+)
MAAAGNQRSRMPSLMTTPSRSRIPSIDRLPEGFTEGGAKVTYDNTYKIGPDPEKRFLQAPVKRIVEETFASALEGRAYDPDSSPHLAREISKMVLDRIRSELPYQRYKIIVQATIGEKKGQTTRLASRCLWVPETDNYASITFQNATFFCTCLVFGSYIA